MDSEKLAIFKKIFGSYSREGRDQFLFHCPECKHHKKKLSINLKSGGKCWICDLKHSNLRYFVKRYGTQSDLEQWDTLVGFIGFTKRRNPLEREEPQEQNVRVELPKEFKTLTSRSLSILASPAMKYLRTRGISRKDVFKWKMGYADEGPYKDRVIIPSFNPQGELDYFVSRTYVESFRKYLNPKVKHDTIVFNELFLDWDKDITVVEGVFDAVVAGNAIPILTSTLREKSYTFQTIVKKTNRIYLALDPDAVQKEEVICQSFKKYGLDVFKIEVAPYQDVGSMTKEEFQKRKEQAVFLSKKTFLMRKMMKGFIRV